MKVPDLLRTLRRTLPEVGLPEGHEVLRLDYHELTRTIIASTNSHKNVPPDGRLFFRCAGDDHYQPIKPLTPNASVESVALDQRRPSLYFIAYTHREHEQGGWSGFWDGLYRFDLGEHRCERVVGAGELLIPAGCKRAWLRELLSVTADGRSLFCEACLEIPTTYTLKTGPVGGTWAQSWVAQLDLTSRELTPLSKLTASWA